MHLLSSTPVTKIRLEQKRKGDPFNLSLLTTHLFFLSFRAVYLLWKGTYRCLQLIKNTTTPANKQSVYGFCASLISPDSQYGIRREVCRQYPQQRLSGQQARVLRALLARKQRSCEQWPAATLSFGECQTAWLETEDCTPGSVTVSVCSTSILLMRTDTVCSILHKLGVIHRFLAKSRISKLNIILRRFLCK